MMVVRVPLFYTRIQYAGESDAQFEARCRAIEAQNAEADRIEQAWKPGPAKMYRKWREQHAPELLDD